MREINKDYWDPLSRSTFFTINQNFLAGILKFKIT